MNDPQLTDLLARFEERGERLKDIEKKVEEMLDILKFWRRLMLVARGALGLLLMAIGVFHYGQAVLGWLHHTFLISKSK